MYEHRLYLDLAAACIDELTHEERVSIPPRVFARLMRICARVIARQNRPAQMSPSTLPEPPVMAFVRAYMLKPGDFVWAENAAYDVVESVLIEDTGPRNAVFVCWRGGGGKPLGYQQPVRIAMNRDDAGDWNALRTEFDADTVHALVAAYGGRRGQ